MKHKKTILFMAVLLSALCMLCACKKDNVVSDESPDGKAEAAPYIQLCDTETGFGLITIPRINPKTPNDSIESVNAMFESIRDDLIANIEEYRKMTGEETSEADNPSPLCTCTYSEANGVLSILVEYGYFFSAPQSQIIAVNIDLETSELVDPQEVIASACYTESEVEAALRCYAERAMTAEWERQLCFEFASRQERINGIGDPTLGWFDQLDEMVAAYKSTPQSTGEKWDTLPIRPSVYLDELGRLYVGADIPTLAGGGYWTTLVCIGHSDAETLRLNSNDPYGEPFGCGMMSENAACEAVAFAMGLDENGMDYNGAVFSLSVERMEFIANDNGASEPAYVVHVFTDEGDHIATQSRWAVEVFTGAIYEMALDGAWSPVMNGTSALPEAVFSGARENGAMATLYSNPTDYEIWAAKPVCELDLVNLGSGGNWMDAGGETALLFAAKDGTTATFEAVEYRDDTFEFCKQLASVELGENECVLIHMLRPEGIPAQAITVFTGKDNAVCFITYDGSGGDGKVGYITPDSAND